MTDYFDIYDSIYSPEIRQYYRENVALTVMEQEQIILYSYCPVERKIELLRQLAEIAGEKAGL